MDHALIRCTGDGYYGRAAINLDNASPTVQNSEIRQDAYCGIQGDLHSFPTLIGNTYTNNAANGFCLLPQSGETIDADTTWAPIDTSYYLRGNITVILGKTLTLSPGIVVKVGLNNRLTINGKLSVQGTTPSPVIITSYKDDEYGVGNNWDTNGGGASVCGAGDWDGIFFSDTSDDTSLVDHALIRCAGDGYYKDGGVNFNKASPTVQNTTFTKNAIGIVTDSSTPMLGCNNIYDNSNYGLYNKTTITQVSAENQWWGDSSGPYHPIKNPGGKGNAVSDGVNFKPFRVAPCGDSTPPTVTSITRADPNPTNAASVHFTVTFSEPVSGVDKTDFKVPPDGVTGASVSSVSGSGATYTVTVNTGTGDGTIRLDVVDNDSIRDAANNPLGGPGPGNGDYTSGEVYDIVFKNWYGGVSINSNRNVVAVGRPHVGAEVMTYNGFSSGSTTAYVPMLFKDAFGGSYDSALYVQNLDPSNSANITFRFYDNSGVQTYSMADTLSPLASKGYWLPSISALGTSWVGGVKVESDRNIVAVGRPHVGPQVMTYNGFSSGSAAAYVPMLFKDAFGGSYDSALYVQNVDPSNTANITIHFYDSSGNETYSMTDTVSPLASKGYWLPSISALGASWVGGVKVESDRDIVAVGRPHIGAQVLTYNGFPSGSLNTYVPMLFKDAFGGSYDSALYIQNVDPSNTANITIHFYDSNGVETYSMTDSVSSLASKGYWLPSISALGSSWVGGVKVESDRDIVAVGRPHVGAQVMAYTGFPSGSTNAYFPMLFKDAFGGSYDSALYLQNLDPSNSADVTIKFYDVDGNLSCTLTDTLPKLSTKGWWLPSLSCTP